MRSLKFFSSSFLIVLHLGLATYGKASVESDQSAFQCDLLAAATDDITKPAGVPGVEMAAINGAAAVAACNDAATAMPNDMRLQFQLGRAHQAWGQTPEKAFALYSIAANAGHVVAMNHLGFAYQNGIGTTVDLVLMRQWLSKAAAAGLPRAQRNLGIAYRDGLGGDRDYAKAMEWFEKSARQGLATAIVDVGILFDDGLGRPKNPTEAAKWFVLAADKGNAEGQYRLAVLHRYGDGVPRDLLKSRDLLEKSVAQGNSSAMVMLAWQYQDGAGVPQDYGKALELLGKADVLGNHLATLNIGLHHEYGWGTKQDFSAAVAFYLRAKDAGNATAHSNLGWLYEQGVGGLPKDDKIAMELYRTAAEMDDADGMNNYGQSLLDGFAGQKDIKEGLAWVNKAHDAGSARASLNLATYHVYATHVARDFEKAAAYFVIALERASVDAREVLVTKAGGDLPPESLNALQDALIKRGATFAKADGKLGEGAIAYMQSILAGN